MLCACYFTIAENGDYKIVYCETHDEKLDTESAAAYIGIKKATLRYHVYQGNITPVLLGNSLLYTRTQLNEFKSTPRKLGPPFKTVPPTR